MLTQKPQTHYPLPQKRNDVVLELGGYSGMREGVTVKLQKRVDVCFCKTK